VSQGEAKEAPTLHIGLTDAIDRVPGSPRLLDGEGSHNLSDRPAAYRARHQPEQRADVRMQGFAE
jgi:hypothetical protein